MYQPSEKRYDSMNYNRCGKSGLKLPQLPIGLWHNFGNITPFGVQQSILRTAFDNGITHFSNGAIMNEDYTNLQSPNEISYLIGNDIAD